VATLSVSGRRIDVPDSTLDQIATLEDALGRRVFYLIVIMRWYGVPGVVRPLGARRTLAQQQVLVKSGNSRTTQSLHLEGRAVDIDVDGWSRDALPREFWPWLRQIAAAVSLRQPLPHWDPGHLEI